MPRRRVRFPDFASLIADLRALAVGCRPLGNWNLAQTAGHLALAMDGCIDGYEFRAGLIFRGLMRPFARYGVLAWRYIPAGIPISSRYIPPAAEADPAAAIAQLERAIERFQSHRGPLVFHPYLGRLSHSQYTTFHLVHAEHHLSFLLPITRG